MNTFLEKYERKVKEVQSDGNCLFRALSDQLFGTESHHLFIRSVIVWFQNLNTSLFASHLPQNQPEIKHHIRNMMEPSRWGTDLKILALATYLQKPIYYVTNSPSNSFHWETIHLLNGNDPLHYPTVMDSPADPGPFTHLELHYVPGVHYRSIVSASTGERSSSIPTIPTSDIYIDSVL